MAPSRRPLVLLALASLATGLAAVAVVGPAPPTLAASDPARDTGDPQLAERVREVFGDGGGRRGLAVAIVEPDGSVRLAGVGDSGDPDRPRVDDETRFEIGSVTKGLTGLLLAEQVARGEVSLDDPVGPRAGATLEDLATHASGLPRLSRDAALRSLPHRLTGSDPYRGGPQDVLERALAEQPRGGSPAAYSNLGAAVAGDLLADRAGTGYGALLTERVLAPLGMSRTTVVSDEDGRLPVPRATGTAASGAPREPWRAEGWAPAGIGVWSTSGDLAALVAALAAGTAPGQEAVEPRADYPPGEIGLFWITTEVDGREVTWHNGGTGGASSFVGFDRGSGRGVVVLSNTSQDVDPQALELLLEGSS